MTYEKYVGTFLAKCFDFQLPYGNITADGQFLLPSNVSQLNDYMCGPMNIVCSECIDGYGPSVTSYEYKINGFAKFASLKKLVTSEKKLPVSFNAVCYSYTEQDD